MAIGRRWSVGSAELAEDQQEEQAELQFGAPDEGASSGGGAMAGSAVAAAGALDDEEWPSLPKRPRSEPANAAALLPCWLPRNALTTSQHQLH